MLHDSSLYKCTIDIDFSIVFFTRICSLLLQVLERCMAALQEIPASQRGSPSTVESLFHMIACCSYHLTKVYTLQYTLPSLYMIWTDFDDFFFLGWVGGLVAYRMGQR